MGRDGRRKSENPVLYIQTLGTLNLMMEGVPFSLNVSVTGKLYQLFLLLVYSGKNGITRTRLQDMLYDRNRTDTANALRINASRLRKLLQQSGLPAHEYVTVKKNIYYLTEDGGADDFQMDVIILEKLWQQSQTETELPVRKKLLEQICSLYQGEFLPMLSGETWVESIRSHSQEVYFQCVKELCKILKQQGEYEELVQIAEKAMRLYPTEEWARLKIDGFVGMQKYADAVDVYKEAVRSIFLEHGLEVSKSMWDRFRSLRQYMQNQPRSLADMKEWLCEENWTPGAYCCSYPGFIDCFRMEARVAERGTRQGVLLACTIENKNGSWIEDESALHLKMEKLDRVVCQHLRRGDIYTRYSKEQILILANDLRLEDADKIVNRITEAFWKVCRIETELQVERIPLKSWLNSAKTCQNPPN